MVIEDPEAGADDGLAIANRIPCQSNSGTDVFVIARNAFHNAEGLLGGGIQGGRGREERADFYVVAHTVIDGQVLIQDPVVLREKAYGDIVEGIVGISNPLDVRLRDSKAVGLEARGARQCSDTGNVVRETKSRGREAAEIHVAPEIEFKNLRLRGA